MKFNLNRFNKKFLTALSVAGIALLLSIGANQATAQSRREGFLRNQLSGRCLDIQGRPSDPGPHGSGGNLGSNAQLWDCSYDNPQQDDHVWILNSDGFLIERNSGHCLDVAGTPGTANGSNIQLSRCEFSGYSHGGQTDQRWELLPGGYLRNRTSGRCIDVSGSPGVNNGANIQLTNCELSGNNHDRTRTDHRWEFVSGKTTARAQEKSWRTLPGKARDVGDGWVIGGNSTRGGYGIYHWDGSNWQPMPGGAVNIGGNSRNPYVVNDNMNIFRWE